ncbi:uncharacterized protein LOC114812908 [Ornithorhynchus anatinus]|uniref:uncharacterized protein LOC114812908 n=1 Tax=Ornithorhynchus anatinus TaxID=9258 RepID=UPI0010A945CF|nr:uncharacterized protein LOC114812908 [Ornithorhynchus anatinus]
MEFSPSSLSFSSLLLFLGSFQFFFIEISLVSLNGTIGQSVHLPLSLEFRKLLPSTLTIKWYFNGNETVASFTGKNCLFRAALNYCASTNFVSGPKYQGRVNFFIEDFSLLLCNLTINDSGIYSVSASGVTKTENIILSMTDSVFCKKSEPTSEPSIHTISTKLIIYISGSCCGFIFLILLLLFWYKWQTGCVFQPQRERKSEQGRVLSVEQHSTQSHPQRCLTIYEEVEEVRNKGPSIIEPQDTYAVLHFPAQTNRPEQDEQEGHYHCLGHPTRTSAQLL